MPIDYTCGCKASHPYAEACKGALYEQAGMRHKPMRDIMNSAPLLSTANFTSQHFVDVAAGVPPSFKIVRAPHLLKLVRHTRRREWENASTFYRLHDALIRTALPHIRDSGMPISDEQLRMYGCGGPTGGAPFPGPHWDTDYYMFPGVSAFQLWLILSTHRERRQGNMFLVHLPPELEAVRNPIRLTVLKDQVMAHSHDKLHEVRQRLRALSTHHPYGTRTRTAYM